MLLGSGLCPERALVVGQSLSTRAALLTLSALRRDARGRLAPAVALSRQAGGRQVGPDPFALLPLTDSDLFGLCLF